MFFEFYFDYAQREKVAFVPNFQPGYDDRALRGQNRAVVERRDGTFFRQSFELATKFLAPPNHVFLTSFNEWFEGTEIESSDEHGAVYLDKLCQLKTEYHDSASSWYKSLWRRFKNSFFS